MAVATQLTPNARTTCAACMQINPEINVVRVRWMERWKVWGGAESRLRSVGWPPLICKYEYVMDRIIVR